MKKNIPLNELPLDELKKKKNMMIGAIIGLGCLMLITISVLIYLAIAGKKNNLIITAITCALTFLPVAIHLQQLNAEISKRNSN
ncbi:MAG: hypothetical protein V4456_04620 [Bacteroidota bacterium]